MSLKINSDSDLDFSSGNLVLLEGVDALEQKIKIRLRFFRGEWDFDTRLGLPLFQKILVKNPTTSVVNAVYREALATTPGVASVDRLVIDFTSSSRTITVEGGVTATSGETLDFSVPFVITSA